MEVRKYVVTIPERMGMASQLKLGSRLVVDRDKDLTANHHRAWQYGYNSGLPYVLVLQDDVIIPDRFDDLIEDVAADMKENGYMFVSLYSNRKEDLEALEQGKPYYYLRDWLNEQGVIMDRRILPGYFSFYEKNRKDYKHWHDLLLADYCRANKIKTMVKIPNIVDHKNIKSSVGHPTKTRGIPRKSRTYGS